MPPDRDLPIIPRLRLIGLRHGSAFLFAGLAVLFLGTALRLTLPGGGPRFALLLLLSFGCVGAYALLQWRARSRMAASVCCPRCLRQIDPRPIERVEPGDRECPRCALRFTTDEYAHNLNRVLPRRDAHLPAHAPPRAPAHARGDPGYADPARRPIPADRVRRLVLGRALRRCAWALAPLLVVLVFMFAAWNHRPLGRWLTGLPPVVRSVLTIVAQVSAVGAVMLFQHERFRFRQRLRCPRCAYIVADCRPADAPPGEHLCSECGLRFTRESYELALVPIRESARPPAYTPREPGDAGVTPPPPPSSAPTPS